MPRYRVLSGFCIEVGRDVYPPENIDLDERTAQQYVTNGRIRPLHDDEVEPQPEVVETSGAADGAALTVETDGGGPVVIVDSGETVGGEPQADAAVAPIETTETFITEGAVQNRDPQPARGRTAARGGR